MPDAQKKPQLITSAWGFTISTNCGYFYDSSFGRSSDSWIILLPAVAGRSAKRLRFGIFTGQIVVDDIDAHFLGPLFVVMAFGAKVVH